MEVFVGLVTLFTTLVVLISPYYWFKSWKLRKQLSRDLDEARKIISSLQARGETSLEQSEEYEAIIAGQNTAIEDLSNQWVNDSLKFICSSVNASNYESSYRKAEKVFQTLRKLNIEFPETDEKQFYDKVKLVYESEVKKDEARREQQIIKERIRDEQKAQKEKDELLRKLEQEEATIEKALERARAKFKDEHSAEVEMWKRKFEEAKAEKERVKSQAELTKAGHVYVISNIGSFGDQIYKVGMTRRIEPLDRVKELSDASVPFPFDVHMMISCENAPELETALHRELNTSRLNKVNLHKEFFKADINLIAKLVEKHHGKVEYRAKAEAFEYNETKLIEDRGHVVDYDPSKEVDDESNERVA